MNVIQCTICRRAAAWMIDNEVFCEGHKERIVETFGVDHFPILRLTKSDKVFQAGGYFTKKRKRGKKRGGKPSKE